MDDPIATILAYMNATSLDELRKFDDSDHIPERLRVAKIKLLESEIQLKQNQSKFERVLQGFYECVPSRDS